AVVDCVQFPARGFVHRNYLTDALGRRRWLTLPVQRCPRNTVIRDVRLDTDREELVRRMRRFPALERESPVLEQVTRLREELSPYLEETLAAVCRTLGLAWNVVRSSELSIDPKLRGQDRILALVNAVGGKSYLNAPGGRDLYSSEEFARRGLELRFLSPYTGDHASVLERLSLESGQALRREMEAQLR
ncbi:MAG: WbqC family protein, partial [Myxococcota bacterium]